MRAAESESFLQRVFRGASGRCCNFCEQAELSDEEISQLQKLLQQRTRKDASHDGCPHPRLLATSLFATLLLAIFLPLRPLLRAAIGSQWLCFLWLALLMRLLRGRWRRDGD